MVVSKILLTGGSGFLGSALARHFQADGYEVAVLMRQNSSRKRLAGREFTFAGCATDDEVLSFHQYFQPQAIVHTACAYGRQGESLSQLLDANVRLGVLLLQAIQSLPGLAEPRAFINTGTALDADVSPYALSKQQFAQWGRRVAAGKPDAMRFVNVQLEHMFGPGDDISKFPTHVLHACHANEPQLKLTAGEQRRDFIYIDDVVSAYTTLLDNLSALAAVVDIGVGSGQAHRVREFVQAIHSLTGSRTQLLFGALPYRVNEAMYCQADIEPMRNLGWRPAFGLTEGLQRMIELEF